MPQALVLLQKASLHILLLSDFLNCDCSAPMLFHSLPVPCNTCTLLKECLASLVFVIPVRFPCSSSLTGLASSQVALVTKLHGAVYVCFTSLTGMRSLWGRTFCLMLPWHLALACILTKRLSHLGFITFKGQGNCLYIQDRDDKLYVHMSFFSFLDCLPFYYQLCCQWLHYL